MKHPAGLFGILVMATSALAANAPLDFDVVADITLSNPDDSGYCSETYLEGAPIRLNVSLGRRPSADPLQGDHCWYSVPTFSPIRVEVVDDEGALVAEAVPKAAPSYSAFNVQGAEHQASLRCFLVDQRLVSGHYVLRFRPLGGRRLAVKKIDPPQIAITVKSPESVDDRYVVARQRAYYHGTMFDMFEVRNFALEMESLVGGCREPVNILVAAYSQNDPHKALVFWRELARRYTNAAKVDPVQRETYSPLPNLPPSMRRTYVDCSLRSGRARTQEEAEKQLDQEIAQLHKGKVPPLDLFEAARMDGAERVGAWRVVVPALGCGMAVGAVVMWLVMRRRART